MRRRVARGTFHGRYSPGKPFLPPIALPLAATSKRPTRSALPRLTLCSYRLDRMRTDTVNAYPTTNEQPTADTSPDIETPAEPTAKDVNPAQLGLSLQLSRASMMALTRLQLAIQSGDRQQAMAAMDRLHALDAEMERLVGSLPTPPDDDAEWNAINRHVSDQKLAIAFEKLALVSEISGPDLVSQGASQLAQPPAEEAETGPIAEPPPLPEWPTLPEVQPTEWKPARPGIIGFLLALLVTVGIAAAAVMMTSF